MELLPLDEVRERLRVVRQSYAGIREIPVERIVGSLDRTADFDREFRLRRGGSRQRIAALRAAFGDGPMPPIEVHEVGGAYFVADGHHRVALARERGQEFVDAEVTRLETNYEIGPDVDVARLVHTEQQRIFGDESGLARARPQATIEFSRPDGYDLARRRGELPAPEEVAADWDDGVYLPGVEAIRREDLDRRYSYKTDGDLFLWMYQRRRALRVTDAASDFDQAARDARGLRVGRRWRRAFLRQKTQPLPRRR